MKRYLLDTCVLIWYSVDDKRIAPIVEDIEYFQDDFAVSMETLKELLFLVQYGKIRLDIGFERLLERLNELNIRIIDFDKNALNALFSLPAYKNHTDPTDRHIIATAIAKKRILVSGDTNFRMYVEHGLAFLEV